MHYVNHGCFCFGFLATLYESMVMQIKLVAVVAVGFIKAHYKQRQIGNSQYIHACQNTQSIS